MCVISLIVFTNTVHGHVTIFIPNGFSLHSNFTHHEHKSLEQEITISFSSKSYYTKTQRLNQINTCFAFCLSLLIWNTQPKTTLGTDRKLTIYYIARSRRTVNQDQIITCKCWLICSVYFGSERLCVLFSVITLESFLLLPHLEKFTFPTFHG